MIEIIELSSQSVCESSKKKEYENSITFINFKFTILWSDGIPTLHDSKVAFLQNDKNFEEIWRKIITNSRNESLN